jgi:hypothetical protein
VGRGTLGRGLPSVGLPWVGVTLAEGLPSEGFYRG